MSMIGKRAPFEADYVVGVNANGVLQGVQLDYWVDSGAYCNDGVGSAEMAMTACDNAYYCPNWVVNSHMVCTNTPATTATRGPGCCPGIFIMETIMDNVAKVLGMSPDAVRFANLYQQGQVTPYGQPLTYCSLSSMWSTFVASTNYQTRLAAVQAYNAANRWTKQGLTIMPVKYVFKQFNLDLLGINALDMALDGLEHFMAFLSVSQLQMDP